MSAAADFKEDGYDARSAYMETGFGDAVFVRDTSR